MENGRNTAQAADEVARLLSVIDVQNELAAAALDLDQIMGAVVRSAAQLTNADAAVIELPERDEMVYRAVAGTAVGHEGTRLKVSESLSGRCLTEHRVLRCDDCATDPRVNREAALRVGATSMLCVPLFSGGEVTGVLKVYADRRNAFDDGDVVVLGQLSATIAAHMNRAEEYERRAHESRADALTGLGNRRAYDERLAAETARAERYGLPLSVVLFDLDGFKRVNDEDGHPAGDAVLCHVARALRATRQSDDCYRVGGDEFALVLANTPFEGAVVVAERVAAQVAELNRDTGVTTSYGIGAFSGGSPHDLHATADQQLLAAKRTSPAR